MKKILLSAIAIVATVSGCLFAFNAHNNAIPSTSDLLLENIEALSNSELMDKVCSYQKVEKNEKDHKLECSGTGSQCCIMD